ncbi:MAG: metal ABC transporter ATP-binding protein [Anaplasmataceae bacterium]|nr:metal ABC transporter ATP-binding protein [Anaplasmataceae bacterium]
MNDAIEVTDLSYRIGSSTILEDLSFHVPYGEFIGIFGPNGGGKTTLLKLLLGFIKPSSGSIHILGSYPSAARTTIGYVPQIARFDRKFPISVLEVVSMGLLRELNRFGTLNHQDKHRAHEALVQVGIEDLGTKPFAALSGGQAQRVLLARALVSNPKILLLDEPTASVDPKAESAIHDLLMTLKGQVTMLMVTHDLQTIMKDVDRLLFIQRNASLMNKDQVCGHFALGLYHSPLQGKLDVSR